LKLLLVFLPYYLSREDQLFELIICAAVGQASRQYEAGLAALAEAKKEGGSYAS